MESDSSYQQIGKDVGIKLREARLAKKYTQSQLAGSDFSVSYISAIERGQIHPSLRALEIFANRLGLSAKDLVSDYVQKEEGGSAGLSGAARGEEELEWQMLEAAIAVRQGAAQEAIPQLEKLLSQNLTSLQEIRVRYLLARAYWLTNQLHESDSVLAKAAQFSKDANDYFGPAILDLAGWVSASLHNYSQGLVFHQQCLELLEQKRPQDTYFLALVYSGLSWHYMHLDKFDEALEMFRRALALTDELADVQQRLSMYWAICQGFVEENRLFPVTLYAYKSLELLRQEREPALGSELYHYLGRAMMQRDGEQAYDYLEKTLQEGIDKRDQLVRASVHTRLAAWFLARDDLVAAKNHLQEAYAGASSSGDTIIAADALIISGQVAYREKNYRVGDEHFEKGLAMLERLDLREELADQLARYAQLLEERGDAGRALAYWKKAFESRRRMGMYEVE